MKTPIKNIICLAESSDETDILYFPKWETVITEGYETLKKVLLPILKINGAFIDPKYDGIPFCLFAHTDNVYGGLEFKLLENGKYKLLRLDDEEMTSEADQIRVADEAEEEDDIFDDIPEDPYFLKPIDAIYSSYAIETGIPTWAQVTFLDDTLFRKVQQQPELARSIDITDYSLSDFQDANRQRMEFICATRSMYHVFGYHYLFYSPTTRVIRQFFECT